MQAVLYKIVFFQRLFLSFENTLAFLKQIVYASLQEANSGESHVWSAEGVQHETCQSLRQKDRAHDAAMHPSFHTL